MHRALTIRYYSLHIYRLFILDEVAQEYLVTQRMKEELKLETNCLKTIIHKENYLNCKKALMELPSTYSGEFKQNVWEVQLCTCRCSS